DIVETVQFQRQPVPAAHPAREERLGHVTGEHAGRRLRPRERNGRHHSFGGPPRAGAGRTHRESQNMCWPPLIAMFAPVRKAASSLARYATRPATSSGFPRRPIGICGTILLSSTSLGIAITIFVPM